MAGRKSLAHPAVDELRTGSPTVSSPLRRSIAQKIQSEELKENDDEAERLSRLARRLEENKTAAAVSNDRRRSLGLGFVAQLSKPQIAERVSRCIKLSTENKINVKNAFSLEMIDFMAYMIKKKDGNMSDLQTASTSLDVSTKIYGFRVDGVHGDILKMIGGMDKQEKSAEDRECENNTELRDEEAAEARTRKKRASKRKILASVESLRGSVETIDPTSLMLGDTDSQTTDLLYQAVFPHHADSGLYLHLYGDAILDSVDSHRLVADFATFRAPRIGSFARDDMCRSFANFEFLGWSAEDDDELDLTPEKSQITVNDGFQFDPDASLPPDDEPTNRGLNDFGIGDDDDNDDRENIDGFRLPHEQTRAATNIIDFRDVVGANDHGHNSEYSYFRDSVDLPWVGPSHWKIRHAARIQLGGSRIVEGCGQEAIRRRKELILAYDVTTRKNNEAKYDNTRGNQVKLQAKTARNYWSEAKLTLPQDMHYDSSQCYRYYIRPDVLRDLRGNDRTSATHVSDEIGDYDYENPNDTTDYCPNIEANEEEQQQQQQPVNDYCYDEMGPNTQAFTGDNLVEAPMMNDKIFLPYSQRAKKIDMRQLKKSIWKNLTDTRSLEKENTVSANNAEIEHPEKIVGTKNFSEIYKKLPKSLSKGNNEALSFPIAFISLLHLANEKNLTIESNDNLSDLTVRQD